MNVLRNSRILRRIPLLIVVCLLSFPAQAKYGGGTGEPSNPYLIYTPEQMNAIGTESSDWNKHFKLMADIDLSKFTGTDFNIIEFFTGVFNGNGHTISNFSYTSTDINRVGIFGLGLWAEIKNLGLINPNVDAGTGTVVAALIGGMDTGYITRCYIKGGSISGKNGVGGLVGLFSGTITNCYATCSVSGENELGGLVGSIQRYGPSSGVIVNSYATGSVSGNDYIGGLVGFSVNWCTIANCYSTGSVIGNNTVGGLVGYSWLGSGQVTGSFWDIQTSGQTNSASGEGKTTAEVKDPNTFIAAGWNFVGQEDGPHDVWAEPEGGGYPILWWQLPPLFGLPSFSGGTGESNDPYLISTATELNSIGHNPRLMRAHFKLINDIDLAGIDFFSIGGGGFPFTNVFDGNGKIISNFSCTSTNVNNVGIFGYASHAEIKDLGLIDPNINAGTRVGSLAARLSGGNVTNCYTKGGNIIGDEYVGGLIGDNSRCTISNCYAAGSVSGNDHIGGLVGKNTGPISNCYSIGDVSGVSFIGGVVGKNDRLGTVSECYFEGTVSGTGSYSGGIAGTNWSEAIISNCRSSGSVCGNGQVGGLSGGNKSGSISDGIIIYCYSTSNVEGDKWVGGLVGSNKAVIMNNYSTGEISGIEKVGGLVGNNGNIQFGFGQIYNSYSSGCVSGTTDVGGLVGINEYGLVRSSFWNMQTSEQTTSDGGIGKTTAEMQTMSTFTDAGWDFIGEFENGPSDDWAMPSDEGYPVFWYELSLLPELPGFSGGYNTPQKLGA